MSQQQRHEDPEPEAAQRISAIAHFNIGQYELWMDITLICVQYLHRTQSSLSNGTLRGIICCECVSQSPWVHIFERDLPLA